jgi:hypothetical protein
MIETVIHSIFSALGGRCSRCGSADWPMNIHGANGRKTHAKLGPLLVQLQNDRAGFIASHQLICIYCAKEMKVERWHAKYPGRPSPYEEARVGVISALGGRCAVCGETRPTTLEFDRLAGPLYPPVSWSAYFKMIVESAEDGRNEYRLLCSNCRQEKRRKARD